MNLRLKVESKSTHLHTDGDVFSRKRDEDDPPVVTDVRASNLQDSLFVLETGTYFYLFAVLDGAGDFKVLVQNATSGDEVASKSFHTKDGHRGRVLRFEVKA